MTRPIPTPRVSMNRAIRQYGVSKPKVERSANPTAVMPVPAMGKRL